MATPPVFTAGQVLTAAQMNAVGLWRNTTCTVTSVGGSSATASNGVITVGSGNTSLTINNAFTTDWNSYKVILTGFTCSAAPTMYVKFNNSTGSTYSSVMTYFGYGSSVASNSNISASSQGSQWFIAATTSCGGELEIFSPFTATQTQLRGSGIGPANPCTVVGIDTNAASQTGLIILPGSGSMSAGTIRVYGYNQ